MRACMRPSPVLPLVCVSCVQRGPVCPAGVSPEKQLKETTDPSPPNTHTNRHDYDENELLTFERERDGKQVSSPVCLGGASGSRWRTPRTAPPAADVSACRWRSEASLRGSRWLCSSRPGSAPAGPGSVFSLARSYCRLYIRSTTQNMSPQFSSSVVFDYSSDTLVNVLVSRRCWVSCFSWLTCCMLRLRSTPCSLAACWAIFLSTSFRSSWNTQIRII